VVGGRTRYGDGCAAMPLGSKRSKHIQYSTYRVLRVQPSDINSHIENDPSLHFLRSRQTSSLSLAKQRCA
jgi:hypothetical protein